jgi:multidrug efflux pump subunit AcrA (membrane-fusion protein)
MRSALIPMLLPLVAASLGGCGKAKQKEVAPNPTSPTLAAMDSDAEEEEAPIEFVGVVTSRNSTVLIAEFTGRIDQFNIHAGKKVKKDELLAKLDTGDIATEIAQLQASERSSMSSAGADAAMASAARVGVKGAERMRRFGAGTSMDLTQRNADARAAGARAGAASQQAQGYREQRKRLEELLPRAEVKSPIDGVVMMVRAKQGEMAQKGTQLARVFDPSDLLFRFAVPKEHRSKVKLGERIQLFVDGVDHPVWATVEQISQELEPPMSFTVVDADIDDTKLQPDEIRVASQGRVRLALPSEKPKKKKKAEKAASSETAKPRTASAEP